MAPDTQQMVIPLSATSGDDDMAGKSKGWAIREDVAEWTMDEVEQWEDRTKASYQSAYEALAEIVVAWPHASDPTDPQSYRRLKPREYTEALREVTKAIFR